MKKKLMLIGAMAILSTRVMGANTLVSAEDFPLHVTQRTNHHIAEGAQAMGKEIGIEPKLDLEINSKHYPEAVAADRSARETGRILAETGNVIKENQRDIKELTTSVNNTSLDIAEGMMESAEKLGIESELKIVEGEGKEIANIHNASVTQADVFDKTVDEIVKNKNDVSDIKHTNAALAQNMVESTGKLGGKDIELNFDKSEMTGDQGHGMIAEAKEKAFDKTVDAIVKNREDIKSTAIWIDEAITPVVKENAEGVKNNATDIKNVNTDLQAHKEKTDAMDKIQNEQIDKLKETDAKVNSQIEKLKETDKNLAMTDAKIDAQIDKLEATDSKLIQTDKDLKEADEKIKQNIATLHQHDSAIYEENVTYRDGAPVVKADVNREMINNLRQATEAEAQQIANNTEKIDEHEEKITINQEQIAQAQDLIDHNTSYIEQNSQRIDKLESKVDNLQSEMNKGFAMSAAMSAVDFQILEVGDAGLGVGVGNYQNAQAVSLGLGLRPTERTTFNVKGAMSTGKKQETMVGAGAVYKFNLFN